MPCCVYDFWERGVKLLLIHFFFFPYGTFLRPEITCHWKGAAEAEVLIHFFPFNSGSLYWIFKKSTKSLKKLQLPHCLLSSHGFFLKHLFCELLQLSWVSYIGAVFLACRRRRYQDGRLEIQIRVEVTALSLNSSGQQTWNWQIFCCSLEENLFFF